MSKIKITEEMHVEKEWFEQAKKQTLETLPDFTNHVMNDYIHDYGTICHAVAAYLSISQLVNQKMKL